MNKKLDISNFEIDENITLDEEELEMLSGIKDSVSILDDNLIKQLSTIAKQVE